MAKKKPRERRVRYVADETDELGLSGYGIVERPAGTGSIIRIRRANGWEAYRGRYWTVDDLGVRKQKYVYAPTYREAAVKMAAAMKSSTASTEMTASTTVDDYFASWLTQVKQENRLATWRIYETTYRLHVSPYIGKVKFKKLMASNVRSLLAQLDANRVGDRTRQNTRKVLHAAYEAAVREGTIRVNPIRTVKTPFAERREQHILTQDEATRLLDAARGGHWYALILLALVSGMREGELFALIVGDLRLDVEHPHLIVSATLTEDGDGQLVRTPPKTQSSRRRVDVDAYTADTLRDLVAGLDRSEHVFTTPDGHLIRKSNFLRRDFRALLAAASLPKVTFHSLRHVANSLLLAEGEASVLDLAKRLGHASPRMTLEKYAHVVPGAQAKIATAAGALFTSATRGAIRGAIASNDDDRSLSGE